jgi:uncharacterized protein DUF4440
MPNETGPLIADREFFRSLIQPDLESLSSLVADDFMLIDVMRGGEVTKEALLALLRSGQLRFEVIEPSESRARIYQGTAVVTGRTQMRVRFGDTSVEATSRYTHVFVQQQNQWRLVAAQGTQIVDEQSSAAEPSHP